MGIRFVRGAGGVVEPAGINMPASGLISNHGVVELSRTGGLGVIPASSASTNTMIFGVGRDYIQGKSDAEAIVIPFTQDQLWEVDCVAAASTAQIGLRHALNDRLFVRNTATTVENAKGVFLALAMTGSTSGSGKLIGRFEVQPGVYADASKFN